MTFTLDTTTANYVIGAAWLWIACRTVLQYIRMTGQLTPREKADP